jgi:peptide/nickel transport system permease protein
MPDELNVSGEGDPQSYDRNYTQTARNLGRDKPLFYFAITNAAVPDTLHRIVRRDLRQAQLGLLNENGNWPLLQEFIRRVQARAWQTGEDPKITSARLLLLADNSDKIERRLDVFPVTDPIRTSWDSFKVSPQQHRLLLPAFHWHGTDNQYHHWLGGILQGDFGTSILDRRPVLEKLKPALKWTALVNGIALLLAYLISLPLGLYMAYYVDSRFDRYATLLLFILFSLPSFWVATMLSNFITTPTYGMDWFPTLGVGKISDDTGWMAYLGIRIHHLFLPIFCLTYPALAYLTRQMRNAARLELGKAYVKTARLKGLNVHQILWRHVFRNALFPIITLLAGLLPSLLAGSILIELIFYLPGMGSLLIDAVRSDDWPIVMAILLLNGLLTILGILLADLLYRLADPRLRLGSSQPIAE